ncbi:MAG: hypothetical protein ABEJ68_07620 [Halobacteriaceae archaeon]
MSERDSTTRRGVIAGVGGLIASLAGCSSTDEEPAPTDTQTTEAIQTASNDGGGLSPSDPDSDGDGLMDGYEYHRLNTSPTDPDSDDDGYSDGTELANLTDPTDPADSPDPATSSRWSE